MPALLPPKSKVKLSERLRGTPATGICYPAEILRPKSPVKSKPCTVEPTARLCSPNRPVPEIEFPHSTRTDRADPSNTSKSPAGPAYNLRSRSRSTNIVDSPGTGILTQKKSRTISSMSIEIS